MNIKVTIPNLTQLTGQLRRFPTIAAPHIQDAINKSLVSIEGKVINGADTPVWHAHLKNDWNIQLGGLQGTLTSQAPYAAAIERGTKPHTHFPPWKGEAGIAPWARDHGIPPFLVARAIWNKGTKANPFMERAIDMAKDERRAFFSTALGAILKETVTT